MEKRLQKILSETGVASRRKAEEMILEGRVTVNGKTAVLGMKADPSADHIKVDGKLLIRQEPKVYLMLNKPRGVVTSLSDPEGRPTVKDFLKGVKFRVYPVGRLDYDSEGLLILTNDGHLANAILHPSKKIPKTYLVKIKGVLEEKTLDKLREGVHLKDGKTQPAKIRTVRKAEKNSWIEITITEGKKRQIRRMLDAVGHTVERLSRVRVGSLALSSLRPGELRHLSPDELDRIKYETGIREEVRADA